MHGPIFDPVLQQFNITSGDPTAWISLGSLFFSGSYTVAWWVLLQSANYTLGAPRIFRFASSTSDITIQAAISQSNYWCAQNVAPS